MNAFKKKEDQLFSVDELDKLKSEFKWSALTG